mmetsp:Transcript_5016/g.11590  ORF Transcript_5016/g.11590 Transcript_5016/m.11590 type:complete len:376 (+) Transcript_5016:1647-2774(+)
MGLEERRDDGRVGPVPHGEVDGETSRLVPAGCGAGVRGDEGGDGRGGGVEDGRRVEGEEAKEEAVAPPVVPPHPGRRLVPPRRAVQLDPVPLLPLHGQVQLGRTVRVVVHLARPAGLGGRLFGAPRRAGPPGPLGAPRRAGRRGEPAVLGRPRRLGLLAEFDLDPLLRVAARLVVRLLGEARRRRVRPGGRVGPGDLVDRPEARVGRRAVAGLVLLPFTFAAVVTPLPGRHVPARLALPGGPGPAPQEAAQFGPGPTPQGPAEAPPRPSEAHAAAPVLAAREGGAAGRRRPRRDRPARVRQGRGGLVVARVDGGSGRGGRHRAGAVDGGRALPDRRGRAGVLRVGRGGRRCCHHLLSRGGGSPSFPFSVSARAVD